ncbi:MAG: DUF6286 domain-containing protein [Mycobacteriaceae bacterium]
MSPKHAERPRPFASAQRPTASPAAAPVAVLLALGLFALGLVALLDALTATKVFASPHWVTDTARNLDGTTAQTWMFPAGIAAAVVGLVLAFIAVKPRRKTGIEVRSSVAMWTRPGDVARLATNSARTEAHVLRASSTATARKVTVTVHTVDQDSSELTARVRSAVEARLAPLTTEPDVSVRAQNEGGPQ